MAEIIPGIAAVAVVLAHRAPLAFTELRPPFFPRGLWVARFFEPSLFFVHILSRLTVVASNKELSSDSRIRGLVAVTKVYAPRLTFTVGERPSSGYCRIDKVGD